MLEVQKIPVILIGFEVDYSKHSLAYLSIVS